MRRPVLASAVGLAVVALALSTGSTAHVQAVPGAAQLVGQAAGTDLFVGVVAERRRAAAFVSDGKRVGIWLRGGVNNGAASLSDGAGSTLTLRLSSTSATGRLQLAGRPAGPVEAVGVVGNSGLFARARRVVADSRLVEESGAWVRLRDGRVRGVRQLAGPGDRVTVFSAPSIPSGAVRITPEALLLRCRNVRQVVPGCGLALDATPASASTTRRVVANPRSARVTAEQLRAVATRNRARLRARAQEAGERFLTDADRRSAEGWAAKLRANAKVKQAAGSLLAALLTGNFESISRRQGEVEATVDVQGLTMPETVRDRFAARKRGAFPPLVSLPRPVATPQTTIVLGPDDFAITEERTAHGDVTYPSQTLRLRPTPATGALVNLARLSVGFTSDGEFARTLVGHFEVPAGVQQVEVQLDGNSGVEHDRRPWCGPFGIPLGAAGGWAYLLANVERTTPAGATIIEEGVGDNTPPELADSCFPVPDPPTLSPSSPRFIRFAPPAGGASYRLVFSMYAYAWTVGLASADSEVYLELERATIRLRR